MTTVKDLISIVCVPYEDTWYKRNDTKKQWPQKSQRILLCFPNDKRLRDAFKEELIGGGRFIWKPDDKGWSLKATPECVDIAVSIFKRFGYDTEILESIPLPKNSDVSATIQGDSVALKWPYLNDEVLRFKVMGIVKDVMGRRWDAAAKVWRIPLAQAPYLKGRLQGVYDPLADALSTLPGIEDIVTKAAERIAISGAASLDDSELIESMRSRLAEQFPEGKELYPFQYVGVRFAELAGGRALIGDDMGIGKTIQAIAYAALHPENYPVLVVCPANVKYNWTKEFKAWLPALDIQTIKKGDDAILDSAQVVIINYDLVKKQQRALMERGFNIIVFDESHYLKNAKAQRTKASLDIAKAAENVLCLSGTAITNRPLEFYTTLNLLRPIEFGNFFAFAKRYTDAKHNGWGWNFNGASNTQELHERTRAFTIRRLKKEVMDDLPDKIRQTVEVEPNPSELKEYRDVHQWWMDQYMMHYESGGFPPGFVLNMLTELRHHAGRMKVSATADWVREYRDLTGKPIVVFAHHRDVIEMLSEELQEFSLGFITGEVNAEKRQVMVDQFQDGKLDVLVCSTIAAKEGLTLTAADTVVFVEREWVPGWEEQAEDRVNRIGQDAETVHAIYLTVKETIDTRFDNVIEQKREVVQAILDGGNIEERSGIAKALLEEMVRAGDIPVETVRNLGLKSKD